MNRETTTVGVAAKGRADPAFQIAAESVSGFKTAITTHLIQERCRRRQRKCDTAVGVAPPTSGCSVAPLPSTRRGAALLLSLLPGMIHIRGIERLTTLVRLIAEEAQAESVGRDLVRARLVEILLVEALRTAQARSHRTTP